MRAETSSSSRLCFTVYSPASPEGTVCCPEIYQSRMKHGGISARTEIDLYPFIFASSLVLTTHQILRQTPHTFRGQGFALKHTDVQAKQASARPQLCSCDSCPQRCAVQRKSGTCQVENFTSESSAMLWSESLCILMSLKTASNMVLKMNFFTALKNFGPASFSFMGPRGKRTHLNERFSFTSCHKNNKETQYVNDFLDTNSVQSVF